jgi:LacI family transcriptional regulator
VILAPISPGDRGLSRRLDIPVVLADRIGDYDDACAVSVDDFVGGQVAATHLLEQGHRRLMAVGGTIDIPHVRERRDGASRAVLLGDAEARFRSCPPIGSTSMAAGPPPLPSERCPTTSDPPACSP